MDYSVNRTWTARLENGTPLAWSQWDLQADQYAAAAREIAAMGLIPNVYDRAYVNIYKNTKAHGNKRVHSITVERGRDGKVRYQR
jgi:hypothetical protein